MILYHNQPPFGVLAFLVVSTPAYKTREHRFRFRKVHLNLLRKFSPPPPEVSLETTSDYIEKYCWYRKETKHVRRFSKACNPGPMSEPCPSWLKAGCWLSYGRSSTQINVLLQTFMYQHHLNKWVWLAGLLFSNTLM